MGFNVNRIVLERAEVFYSWLEIGHEWPVDCMRLLDREDEKKLVNLRDDRMRKAFMLERCFRRTVLGGILDTAPEGIRFVRTDNGKPFLADYPNVHFNVSKSETLIAMAVSDQVVGLDVEVPKGDGPKSNMIQYLNRYRSPQLKPLPADLTEAEFLTWWVSNEAIQKYYGLDMETYGWAFPFDRDSQNPYLSENNLFLCDVPIPNTIARLASSHNQ